MSKNIDSVRRNLSNYGFKNRTFDETSNCNIRFIVILNIHKLFCKSQSLVTVFQVFILQLPFFTTFFKGQLDDG